MQCHGKAHWKTSQHGKLGRKLGILGALHWTASKTSTAHCKHYWNLLDILITKHKYTTQKTQRFSQVAFSWPTLSFLVTRTLWVWRIPLLSSPHTGQTACTKPRVTHSHHSASCLGGWTYHNVRFSHHSKSEQKQQWWTSKTHTKSLKQRKEYPAHFATKPWALRRSAAPRSRGNDQHSTTDVCIHPLFFAFSLWISLLHLFWYAFSPVNSTSLFCSNWKAH